MPEGFGNHTRIGTVLSAHGIKGEVKVLPHTESSEYYAQNLSICKLSGSKGEADCRAEKSRYLPDKNLLIVKFDIITNRDEAEALKGTDLLVPDDMLAPTEDSEYFIHQLIGCTVSDKEGKTLGVVEGYFDTGANGILEMKTDEGTVLVPYTNEVIIGVCPEEKSIVIELIPGLLELNRKEPEPCVSGS